MSISKKHLECDVYFVMRIECGRRNINKFKTCLEAIHNKKLDHLHIATVGNLAMHMPTMLGGLPGMEAITTSMMKKEMEKIDMPDVREFLEILIASGVKLWTYKLAMDMFHCNKEEMIEDLDGASTVGDFYKQGSGVGIHMLFI